MLIVHSFVSYAHVNPCHVFSSSWCRGLAAAVALPGLSCLPFYISVRAWTSRLGEDANYS